MYPEYDQDTLAYTQDTLEYMQNTSKYKEEHVFQALGRVRSRAQLNAHRIRLEYIEIRLEYVRICISQHPSWPTCAQRSASPEPSPTPTREPK